MSHLSLALPAPCCGTDEIWLPIEGYESLYEASDHGRVRSLDRIGARPSAPRLKGRVLKMPPDSGGYPQVTLCKDRIKQKTLAHTLVASAFLGPRPDGQEVCHGDGDPQNNHVGNLRYDTHEGNSADMIRHGRTMRGTANSRNRLSPEQVLEIVAMSRRSPENHRPWRHHCAIAKEFGVSVGAVEGILRGKTWSHLTGL